MYARRLSLDDWNCKKRAFDGVVAYAEAKSALVVVTEICAARLAGSGVTVNAMHPGWADTPAVRASLPRFRHAMASRLRTPEEGADTVIWWPSAPGSRAKRAASSSTASPARPISSPGQRKSQGIDNGSCGSATKRLSSSRRAILSDLNGRPT